MSIERYNKLLRHLISLHEAAHARVGLDYEWTFAEAKVAEVEDASAGDDAGYITWARETDLTRLDSSDATDRRQVWELMVITFAGPSASVRAIESVNREARQAYLADVVEADLCQADRCAKWLADHRQRGRVRFGQSAYRISRRLVGEHWEEIRRLAHALRKAGVMSQDEVIEALESDL